MKKEKIKENWKELRELENAIERLKGILTWSDRIGSDERAEIENIIKILNN